MRAATALIALIAVMLAGPARAQNAGGLEDTPDYKETQSAISNAQKRVEQMRKENEARAKEMDAITSKVSDALSVMSSQSGDFNSLRAEVSGLNDQLTAERKNNQQLKSELDKINADLDKVKKDRDAAIEGKTANQKRLAEALDSISQHARTNRQLTEDIANLQKENEQLRKQAELRRRLNSPQPQNALPK